MLTIDLLIPMKDVIVCIRLFKSFKKKPIPNFNGFRGWEMFELINVAFFEVHIKRVEVKMSSILIICPLLEAIPYRPALFHNLSLLLSYCF